MAVLTQLSQLEDRHVPTTTLEGWRRFVEADPAMFELLPAMSGWPCRMTTGLPTTRPGSRTMPSFPW